MGRNRKTAKRNRDGVSIEQLPSGLWRYRVRDTRARRYISQTYAAQVGHGQVDELRRAPGCAEGDAWSDMTIHKLGLRMTSAGKALVETLAEDYVSELTANKRSATHVREVQRVLADLAKAAPDMKADGFHGQVLKWRDGLKAKKNNEPKDGEKVGKVRRVKVFDLSPVTINRYVLHARSLVKYAIDHRELHHNPLVGLKELDATDPIKATFALPELRSLVALQDYGNGVWLWAVIMAFTGMRTQEALHLRWQDVHLDDGLVYVRLQPGVYDLKRVKERTVPMAAGFRDLLQAHPGKRDQGFIVADKAVREGWNKVRDRELQRVCAKAGFKQGERTPHSFRHTYAAIMVAAREDVFSICRALGHADLSMTEHYSREAAGYRPTITREGWKPGELRLAPHPVTKEKTLGDGEASDIGQPT